MPDTMERTNGASHAHVAPASDPLDRALAMAGDKNAVSKQMASWLLGTFLVFGAICLGSWHFHDYPKAVGAGAIASIAFLRLIGLSGPMILLAIVLHIGAAAGAIQATMFSAFSEWAGAMRAAVGAKLAQTYDVDMLKPPEPPPPPPKEEEPPKEVVKQQPKEEPPPPPALAQAGKVLAADPAPGDTNKELDFTQGNADTYGGGQTISTGTGKAVYNPLAVATGVPGGTGTGPAKPVTTQDLSRGAHLKNNSALSTCPFPPEAEAEQIDDSYVTVEVKITAAGSPESINVLQDPGHGFGREARKCAMRAAYDPALDATGKPLAGTARIRFHFSR